MTTPPVDPEPPEDVQDVGAAGAATSADEDEREEDSDGTDAMGIDDEDPIDATLVGSPVDDDNGSDQRRAAPTTGADPDSDS